MGNLEVKEKENLNQKHNFSLLSYLISIFLAIFLYVFFEWLFIVTKPSFMSMITLREKIFILIYSFSLLSFLSLIVITPLNYVKKHIKNKNLEFAINFLVIGLTSFLLSSITLMLTDNFTYTLFKLGIITSERVVKVIYLVFFISLNVLFSGEIIKFYLYIYSKISKNFFHKIMWIVSILVTIIALLNPVKFIASKRNITQLNFTKIDATNDLPNIFLFTCESCNADHFSLYGYKRNTTPFLEKISDQSLVSMNAFSNAQGTTGSTTSILTGKYPTDTRVIYAPDILHNNDAYQHLPGILKIHGYYSAQLSFNWYADAYDLNFKNGFSEANGRSNETNDFLTLIYNYVPPNSSYFLYEIGNRLVDRLAHIFFIKEMENPYEQVGTPVTSLGFNDDKKINDLISLLNDKEQPLFVHFHWMGTHGPKYFPKQQVFSAETDLNSQGNYDIDLYDDSILEFDSAISEFYQELANRSLDDKSILIITSDHSKDWTKSRLPLLIKFPNSEFTEKIIENTQHIDIAPTILDYLDIPEPDWMSGQSLLSNLEKNRPIFVSVVGDTIIDEATQKRIQYQPKEPFFQFGKVASIICNKWYEIDLRNFKLNYGLIEDYYGDCSDFQINGSDNKQYLRIYNHLEMYGFDVSSIEELINQ